MFWRSRFQISAHRSAIPTEKYPGIPRPLRGKAITVLQPPAQDGSSLADFYTLKMEAIRSSEMSVHTRSTWRHIPEDGILYSHRRENLKSYTMSNLITDNNSD
jgi:hypothetical protein